MHKTFRNFSIGLIILPFLLYCSTRKNLPVEGPPALNEQEQIGERIYMESCQRCHPQGEAGLGPSIHWAPNFAKRFQIRHGVGAMPAFDEEHVSKTELDQLVSYLKALKKN